jgi:hypothetical protein
MNAAAATAQVPPAPGLHADGRRALFAAPPWPASHGFWRTLGLAAQLSAQGFQLMDAQREGQGAQAREFFRWDASVQPHSPAEQRLIIGTQMRVCQLSVRPLCQAQLVAVAPKTLDDVEFFAEHEDAQRWALGAELPHDPVYLDFATSRQTAAMRVAGSQPWAFAGALCHRDAEVMVVVPFAAPSGEDGPAFQPLGRVLLGDFELAAAPAPGDIAIDARTGNAACLLAEDPASRINRRAAGAVALTTGALSVLRHLTDANVELVPAVRDPRARSQALAAGARMALAPRRRPRRRA